VRADFFFGFGPQAVENAGKMKQRGQIWVLLPLQAVVVAR
jgi:membrane-bound lytic murein transglycosylase A